METNINTKLSSFSRPPSAGISVPKIILDENWAGVDIMYHLERYSIAGVFWRLRLRPFQATTRPARISGETRGSEFNFDIPKKVVR